MSGHLGNQGMVHALKGAEIHGVGLDSPTAQDHLPVKGQEHACAAGGGHGEGGAQVVLPIGEGMLQRQLRPGEHHRDGDAQQHEAEHGGGIGHGVRAVGQHHPVKGLPGSIDLPGKELPLLRLDVGGVQVQDVPDRDLIGALQRRQGLGKDIRVLGRGQALPCQAGGDGAAGGEQEDFFHASASIPRSRSASAWMAEMS